MITIEKNNRDQYNLVDRHINESGGMDNVFYELDPFVIIFGIAIVSMIIILLVVI